MADETPADILTRSEDGGYLAESYKDRLPKAGIGKSWVRFKWLSDLDLNQLRALLEDAGRLRPAGAA